MNVNDCPIELAQSTFKDIKKQYEKINVLLTGYGGAGPYPKCFENLKDYPFEPFYTNIQAKDGTSLRIHHIDVGPKDGPILLAMHGQPVWSYLYARMIPILNKSGIRVIAPDLV